MRIKKDSNWGVIRANSPNQYHENYIADNYWWDLESELDKMWMSTKFS